MVSRAHARLVRLSVAGHVGQVVILHLSVGWALLMLRMLDAHCAESVVSGSARTASLHVDETEIRSPQRWHGGFVKPMLECSHWSGAE